MKQDVKKGREAAHYHTVTSEYCYILSGTTKYVDLFDGTEHEFRAGDFYILRKNTPYIQKCQAGCRLLFAKVPGINDKISIPMSARMRQWCEQWNAVWRAETIQLNKIMFLFS